MFEDETDSALVLRIAAARDERDAEAELCRRFAPRIRLYGLRHLRNEDRARDLVQAVLLAVLVAVRTGRVVEPEHFDRFVLGTCRNIASRVRANEARMTPLGEEEAAIVLASLDPSLERLDVRALIHCLSQLDGRARAVVFMSFHEEREPQEIAGALGTSLGNVRVIRHRAIKELRQCLGEAP